MISNYANDKRQLQRNLKTCYQERTLQSCKTDVRPIVEHSSPAWDAKNKHVIELRLKVFKERLQGLMND